MDKFKTVLSFVSKQTNLGLVALLTAGGEQVFSSVVFRCPCNELNFLYGMVFLLVPALALLLLGYIVSKKTWKLLTGLCQRRHELCRWRRLLNAVTVFVHISTVALVAPSSWIAVALLNGNYYECAMTGTNVSAYNQHLCKNKRSVDRCERELFRVPCDRSSNSDKDEVLLTLRAESQIIGWLLISSIMMSNLLLTCVARCTSPVSYLQLKFWRAYAQEESNMMDSYTVNHAKALAERNVKSFFNQTTAENFTTPSNKNWEKISSLYKFSTKDHYYSTLHRHVENCEETDNGMMRMASIRSSETAPDNPAVLNFVDEGRIVF